MSEWSELKRKWEKGNGISLFRKFATKGNKKMGQYCKWIDM